MELKSTKKIGIKPSGSKKSELSVNFYSISEFMEFLQENKIDFEQKSDVSFIRTLDHTEVEEVKDKVLELTLDTIPEKERILANYKDASKQRTKELESDLTCSETERKSLCAIAKKREMFESAEAITVNTTSKKYHFALVNSEVELISVQENYSSSIFNCSEIDLKGILQDENE